MTDNWRFKTKSITKYNPLYRDENGNFTKNEWIVFFQIGVVFDERVLTFESYLEVEDKYIKAILLFFKFHNTSKIILNSLEKNSFPEYPYEDKKELLLVYNKLNENHHITQNELPIVAKLILRNLIWAELFDNASKEIAIRFGYDFYMYFNSNKNLDILFPEIEKIGLYVD
ncbi:hypothetical protein [Ferruginibacter sp.]|nr:hypothetical protein [Ferruginibacter sp.]